MARNWEMPGNPINRRSFCHLFEKTAKYDLLSILKHAKPSYLWDICQPTADLIQSFTRKVSAMCGAGRDLFHILQLEEDMVVCDLDRLFDYLQRVLSAQNIPIVDVSSTRAEPAFLPAWPSSIGAMLSSLTSQLGAILSSANSSGDRRRTWNIETGPDWNLCTAFGFLLGFPVIYWFSGDSTASNCLALQQLCAVKVHCRKRSLYDGATESDSHPVYSFSFPLALKDKLDAHVSRWFEGLSQRCSRLQLTVTKETFQLPHVAL